MTAHFVNLLDELKRCSLRMAGAVEDMVDEACEAALQHNHQLAERVIERDREIDQEEVAIEAEVIRLMSLFQPMAADMRLLCTILKINNDLERIADCAVNIAERARHVDTDLDSIEDLRGMIPLVKRSLRAAFEAYAAQDAEVARKVLVQDQAVDEFYSQMIRKLSRHALDDDIELADALDLLSIAKNLERIADHATNIAEDVIYLVTGHIVRHNPEANPRAHSS